MRKLVASIRFANFNFMALGDVQIQSQGAFGYPGSEIYNVAASATLILAGEPVAVTLGNSTGKVVAPLATNAPVVGTDYMVGIAATTSTNTASAAGTVQVTLLQPGMKYLCSPKVAASWDTQAEYDALVGARVLFDLTTGVYTVLATDGATSGLVVQPLNIAEVPGKVCFAIRNGVSNLS